ncbi:MAG: 4Fe-4S dicluster domain-containing protein [Clostridia bacterium]|nr:4Fe-4S dicluster domain-containing protein [Clostridia bacterium]
MQEMINIMKNRAIELMNDGTVARVIGWSRGEFVYDMIPTVFNSVEDVEKSFAYSDFCGSNLSKYLIEQGSKEGKTLVFLKPCDTYSFNQLLTEHRIDREKVYVVGIECQGKLNYELLKKAGVKRLVSADVEGDTVTVTDAKGTYTLPAVDVLAERCVNCKSRKHVVYDELIGQSGEVLDSHRFDMVAELEALSPTERFEFWQEQLSKCIRCNACRKVCPACTCEKCVFDNDASGIATKANSDSFEEKMYHIIRAFHVVGRCTDCGECSRVCPENIPLHLLNRKFIKDINELYGEYQAGEEAGSRNPLVSYTTDDCEPDVVYERGGNE